MGQEITLTREEIEEIKDTAGFRAKVILELKLLRNIPKKVTKLEVWSRVQWGAIFFVLCAILTKALKFW